MLEIGIPAMGRNGQNDGSQTPLFVGKGDVLELGVTAMWIEPVEFGVAGDVLRGDLYRPEGAACPPVVVMAHGFDAERRFRLPAFAERS